MNAPNSAGAAQPIASVHGQFLGPAWAIDYARPVKRNEISVPMGACPYNPRIIPTSTVYLLSIDTGPLGVCQALPCFGVKRRRRRCR